MGVQLVDRAPLRFWFSPTAERDEPTPTMWPLRESSSGISAVDKMHEPKCPPLPHLFPHEHKRKQAFTSAMLTVLWTHCPFPAHKAKHPDSAETNGDHVGLITIQLKLHLGSV